MMSSELFQSAEDSHKWKYDVFLSFRGTDTRQTFTSHLYQALKDKGVHVFIDSQELQRGAVVGPTLRQAIRGSRILVVVFSRNYAESRWCLQELEEIMDCCKTLRRTVLPVFYDVNPSDIRKQTGCFGEGFLKHKENTAFVRWRAVLTEAANLSGWDATDPSTGSEADIIRNIAKTIWIELKHTALDVAVHPVGLDYRAKPIIEQLNGDGDVRSVGICGMGGIGKTTLAKFVYNRVFRSFESWSFLASVRETCEEPNGLVHLQEQLLCDVLKLEKLEVGNVHRGISVIRERLSSKKVLIVVDDVSDSRQLKALVRQHSWFGRGSRIIITTRNEDVLKEIDHVDYTCMVEVLNCDDSLNLFNRHAFNNSSSSCREKKLLVDLSKQVVTYCGGLPLALEVLGSYLHGLSIEEWKSAVEKLKRIPDNNLQKQLKISYDALDDNEKEIFLHVACFYVSYYPLRVVIDVMDNCFGLFGKTGISLLTKRCLVKVDERGKLDMHDLIRDMGREIVRQESPNNPGSCSRLWSSNDVMSTLEFRSGSSNVQGLKLVMDTQVEVDAASFSGMKRLKYLWLVKVHIRGNFEMFPKELKFLRWEFCPLKSLPNFNIGNVTELVMRHSKLKSPWKAMQFLGNLTDLDLCHSCFLTNTPDFSRIPKLRYLYLVGCVKLKHIHETIGQLEGILLIDLTDCKELERIPDSISMSKSLEGLVVSGCSKLTTLPDIQPLISLAAERSGLTRVKSSYHHRSSSALGTSSPGSSNCFSSLIKLSLSWNGFSQIPRFTTCLPKLHTLCINHCRELRSLSDMPPTLRCLFAFGCTSLQRVSLMNGALRWGELYLSNCPKLEDISGLRHTWNLHDDDDDDNNSPGKIIMDGCNNLSSAFKEMLLNKEYCTRTSISLPGRDFPEWVDCQSSGASLSFRFPRCRDGNIDKLIFCFTFEPAYNRNLQVRIFATLVNKTTERGHEMCIDAFYGYSYLPLQCEDQMFIGCFQEIDTGKGWFNSSQKMKLEDVEVELTIRPSDEEMKIKSVGVHLHIQKCINCQPYSSNNKQDEIAPPELDGSTSIGCPCPASTSRINPATIEEIVSLPELDTTTQIVVDDEGGYVVAEAGGSVEAGGGPGQFKSPKTRGICRSLHCCGGGCKEEG